MEEAKTATELRVHCQLCNCSFVSSRGSKIECDNGHELTKDFPYDNFWNYCCGCDALHASNGNGSEAESNCFCCDRPIERRFLCSTCNVVTLDAGSAESRHRPVEFSADGYPHPSCPGCLLPATATSLSSHDCYSLLATLSTERQECPFCEESIVKPEKDREPKRTIETGKSVRKRNFPLFKSFTEREVSFLNWKAYLPTSREGWSNFGKIAIFFLTVVGVFVAVFPAVPVAIGWRLTKTFKNPLTVSQIECPVHFVLAGERLRLTAKAREPLENIRFSWTTTAGSLINQKDQNGQSEVELDTRDIQVLSVPREVSVTLHVGNDYGESVTRQERITVMPRRLANNPPVLKIPPRCNCILPEVVAGESVSLYAMADDVDRDDEVNYIWQSSFPSAQLIPTTAAAGSTVILNTAGINPKGVAVPVQIYLTVKDGNGGEVMGDTTIMVLPKNSATDRNEVVNNLPPQNRAPKLEAFSADKTEIEPGEPVRLWAFVSDADGDSPIYYDWRVSAGDIQNKNETAILNTKGVDSKEVIIFLTVSDGRGGKASQELFVKVRNTSAPAAPAPVQAKENNVH